jgi:alcohol dehydrogenase (cytochrome c)
MRLWIAALRPAALTVLALAASAQQSDVSGSMTFENHCSTCHGGDGSGGDRAPSLTGWIRYHTDSELSDLLRTGRVDRGMPSFVLNESDLKALMAHLRELVGTNPAMATAGLTGKNRKLPNAKVAAPGARYGLLKLASGGTLEGTILNEGDFSAVVLTADKKFHLLERDGESWREKTIGPKADWTTYHGSISGNRYSSLEQINSGNVRSLTLRWMFPIPSSPRIEATPIVVDGVMYVTGWNEVWVLDATSGQQIWMFRQPHTDGLLSEAGRGANRGVAVSGDSLFTITDNAHLLALDRWTGSKLWGVEMGSVKDSYSATGAPLVVGNLVISGVAGGEEGARGFVDAYEAATGKHVWRFNVIPKRGEKGSETWIGNALEHGCGATWLTGSYDPALDLVYWQTGNPCPDFNGDERNGDNLYTASVVALSAKTGELKWHFQFTPHDLHDWDATEPLLLLDQPWRGQPRKLLVHADRNGFFFVLDRINGELLLAEPFVKVNWATGYGKDGRPILTENYETTNEGTLTCQASSGGTNWPANAWSPVTKLFYVRASDWCAIYRKQADPLVDDRWMGGTAPNQPGALNFIRALDINTGHKVWEYPFKGNGRGGLIATAGGLVFFGSSEGALVALDATHGKPLWHFSAGQNWQASPMTYMVGGRQYIVLPGPAGVFAFALPD